MPTPGETIPLKFKIRRLRFYVEQNKFIEIAVIFLTFELRSLVANSSLSVLFLSAFANASRSSDS